LAQYRVDRFSHALAVSIFERLVGGERQHFARIDNGFNANIRIYHCLSNAGIPAPHLYRIPLFNPCYLTLSFSGGPDNASHVRLHLILSSCPGLVNHRGCANGGACPHVDAIAGDGNQGTGRGGIVVNKNPDRKGGIEDGRTDGIGKQDLTTIRVHMDEHRIEVFLRGLQQAFLNQQPGIAVDVFL